jgi:hypothetical protein
MRWAIAMMLGVCLMLGAPMAAQAFTPEAPPALVESIEREAKEAAERHQQDVAQQEREAQERAAKEAQQHETEAKARQAAEEAEREREVAQSVVCVVPALKGDSIARARQALLHSHCKLGRVSKPPRSHGALVVLKQSAPHGKKLPREAVIAVTLGPRPH